ncbi:hypothetical protein SFC43_27210 [Bacteroides sp. CR5/BHMF/2]|nr:hypothetical protein [Bacteroides sp. CR5/BHMF/2]
MTDKVKVPEVTDELRQYWKERSERILRNYEAGKYDENNKAMMASVSWARLSMEEKEEGYKSITLCLTAGRRKLMPCVDMMKTIKISI